MAGGTLLLLFGTEPGPPTTSVGRRVGKRLWLLLQSYDQGGLPNPAELAYEPPSDVAVLAAIAEILRDSGEFSTVRIVPSFEQSRITSQAGRAAFLETRNLRPAIDPDGSPSREFRRVTYSLVLAVTRVRDKEQAYKELDRMERAVRDVLLHPSAKKYRDYVVPRFSDLRAGQIDQSGSPSSINRLTGTFAYAVSFPSGGYDNERSI